MRISPCMPEAMSPEQEVLIDADSLPFTPAFPCRHLPSLHPYVAVERSPAAMSRCHSHDVDPWGTYHYRPGCKRYWCHGCKRTFNDLTNTLLHQSKRSLPHWILATFLLCLACSSRRIAREVGLHICTSYRWCGWLRNAALSYEMHRQLEGTIEADAQFIALCSPSILAETLGYAASFSSPLRGKRRVFERCKPFLMDQLQPSTNSDKLSENC